MKTNYLVNVLTKSQRTVLAFLVFIWLLASTWFWQWWLSPEHWTNVVAVSFNSFVIFWMLFLPCYYLFYFLFRMKKPNPDLEIPSDWRVAMIVTRAPSEPFELVKKMLLAMKAQDFPHDTWLADESPAPEIVEWCRENNVHLSCRKGVPGYHNKTWPRREKCKEGNLAFFYDRVGYANYDFVSQMDADHIPEPGYLRKMLQGFLNPKVGYVSAPSMNDRNIRESWINRGRIYSEATLHGPLQAGYHSGWAPICIGSHYAVRTKALEQVGGLGPELAEDHTTTFLLAAGGWKGVHSIDAIAHGEGPATFKDAMLQEFQWARSLMMVVLQLTPKHIGKLSFKMKFQFLFGQFWYLLYALAMAMGFALSPIALILNFGFMNHMTYVSYLGHILAPTLFSFLTVSWIRRAGLFRPVDAKILNWEIALFQLARWPYVLWACFEAIKSVLFKEYLVWRVTPKKVLKGQIAVRYLSPYYAIASLWALIAITHVATRQIGYFWLTMWGAFNYVVLIWAIHFLHSKEIDLREMEVEAESKEGFALQQTEKTF